MNDNLDNQTAPIAEPASKFSAEAIYERLIDYTETSKLWLTKSWHIALMMAKGGYLTTERRRLYERLGEEVFFRIQKGELKDAELEARARDLVRLTRKLELEDAQIRAVRFGKEPVTGAEEN